MLAHHCYVELGRLSALRALALDDLAMGVSHDWTGDDVLPAMLGLMTRLTALILRSVDVCSHAAIKLMTLGIPKLPHLVHLDLDGNPLREGPFLLLARMMSDGGARAMQNVCVPPGVAAEDVQDLNWVAGRAPHCVFTKEPGLADTDDEIL